MDKDLLLLQGLNDVEDFEPWMTAAIATANCCISKVKEVVLFSAK